MAPDFRPPVNWFGFIVSGLCLLTAVGFSALGVLSLAEDPFWPFWLFAVAGIFGYIGAYELRCLTRRRT